MIDIKEEDIIKNFISRNIEVSICCITYNHQDFISYAIDSFLTQKSNFAFEILIDDDCSTDNTQNIINSYQKKYPNLIKANLREKNIGAINNSISNINRAKGKYIALCEGDDYWIDDNKLQIQVDFLNKNIEYSGFGHNSKVIYPNNKSHNLKTNIKEDLILDDILHYHQFQTASFVFRTYIMKKNPLPLDIFSGDKAIFYISTIYGKIKYIDKPMSIYRKHNNGISSNIKPIQLLKDLNIISYILTRDKNFPKYRFRTYVYEHILRIDNIGLSVFLKYYLLYSIYSFSFFPKNISHIIGFGKKIILKIIR